MVLRYITAIPITAYTKKPCTDGNGCDAFKHDTRADDKKNIQIRNSFLLSDRCNVFRDVKTVTVSTANVDMMNKISRGIKYQDNSPVGPSIGRNIKRKNIQMESSRLLFIDCF
jgi:hypothetical protein